MKPSEVLAKAADLIEPEGAWTQGHYARVKPGGNPIGPLETNATCWCAKGAIIRAAGENYAGSIESLWALATRAKFKGSREHGALARWNDAETRQPAEVVKALRDAADLARAEGC